MYITYTRQKRQISYDGGATWEDVTPPEYIYGEFTGMGNCDCDNRPCDEPEDVPFDGLFKITDTAGKEYIVPDDGTTVITKDNVNNLIQSSGANVANIYSLHFSGNVEEINTGSSVYTIFGFSDNVMREVKFEPGIKTLGNYVFRDIELSEVNFPEGLESIGNYTFNKSTVRDVILPSTLKQYGYSNFTYGHTLTIYAVNPPELSERLSSNVAAVYVPAESVETYKSAKYWSDDAKKIYSIEEKP